MNIEIRARVQRALEQHAASYEILECDPELADTAVFCARYGYPLERSANTIIVGSKTGEPRYVACLLLANARLDVNRTVRKRLGVRRLSFASPEETRSLTGMELGGVTPLALPPELPLWVDGAVMEAEFVILGGGDRTSKVKTAPDIFLRTPNTTIVRGLAQPSP